MFEWFRKRIRAKITAAAKAFVNANKTLDDIMQNTMPAAFWYKKAADVGDGNGARCYADMLMIGNGVARNPQQTMHHYADAADKGVQEAAFVPGEFLRNSGDRENAIKAYQQVLSGGYQPASVGLQQKGVKL